jgi:hemerythrin superfamily protein
MDIYGFIKKDHRKVQELLDELEKTQERTLRKRETLLQKITEELVPHNKAEEKLFYPRLDKKRDDRLLMYEGQDEHALGARLLDELAEMDASTEEWSAKAKVLKDLVNHHIEEEEGEIHPAAKKILSKEEAVQLGQQFEDFKERVKGQVTGQRTALRKVS